MLFSSVWKNSTWLSLFPGYHKHRHSFKDLSLNYQRHLLLFSFFFFYKEIKKFRRVCCEGLQHKLQVRNNGVPFLWSRIDVHLFSFQIWDIQDQCCLFTADPKASRIHGDITACLYSAAMKSLYIAGDCMAALSLKIRLPVMPLYFIPHRIQCSLSVFWEYSCTELFQGGWPVKF